MGYGKLEWWINGEIHLDKKTKRLIGSFDNQYSIIPPFHYSVPRAISEASKKFYFQLVVEILIHLFSVTTCWGPWLSRGKGDCEGCHI